MGRKRKAREFAPGIYDPTRFEPIPTFGKSQKWNSVIHEHLAFKAGKHFDLRLLEPGTDSAHSWAIRRLPKPGEKVLAVQQPTHSADYMDFKGVIPKGYGAGAVKVHSRRQVRVLRASPEKITFRRGRELFTLVRAPRKKREKDWLLLNRTKTANVAGTNNILALVFANALKGTNLQRVVDRMRKGV